VDKNDRDDIAIARLLCRALPVDGEPAAFSVGDDSSDTQVKIEAFLFTRQR
jgi:hypothetical protein